MAKVRQQILILHVTEPNLEAQTIAWAAYDASLPKGSLQMQTGDSDVPPYDSVLDAMRDGWFVLQLARVQELIRGHEHETGHLPYEYVLERKVTIDE